MATVAGLILSTGNLTTAMAGLEMSSIRNAHRYSASGAGLGMIVWEAGQIRFEDYYNGHSVEKPLHIYSGTKSFFGVLAAIGVEEGWLDLDEPVSKTIPEWKSDPRRSRIIIRDLLDFTSGLETGFSEIYGRENPDKCAVAITLKAEHERGTAFVYGPSHLQVFCEVVQRKLKRRGTNYESYLYRKLIHPLQISIPKWRDDAVGNPCPSAGMYMTGRDWLKFGVMVVQGGNWNGKQLVETDSLRRCFVGTRINPSYGTNFWLNGYARQPDARVVDVEEWLDEEPMPTDWSRACLSKGAPSDMVAGLGSNFQRLYIVPSMQLVVVHLGKEGKFSDDEFLKRLFASSSIPQTATPPREPESFRPKIRFGGLFKKKKNSD